MVLILYEVCKIFVNNNNLLNALSLSKKMENPVGAI